MESSNNDYNHHLLPNWKRPWNFSSEGCPMNQPLTLIWYTHVVKYLSWRKFTLNIIIWKKWILNSRKSNQVSLQKPQLGRYDCFSNSWRQKTDIKQIFLASWDSGKTSPLYWRYRRITKVYHLQLQRVINVKFKEILLLSRQSYFYFRLCDFL